MIYWLERDRFGGGTDHFVEKTLVALGDLDVFDRSAVDAHNMMVVAPQPVGDLIPGNPSASVVGRNHTGALQHSQCAIERRQGEVGEGTVEFGGGLGTVAGEEGFDDGAPSPRVANIVLTKS